MCYSLGRARLLWRLAEREVEEGAAWHHTPFHNKPFDK